jgi:hypothetical protein
LSIFHRRALGQISRLEEAFQGVFSKWQRRGEFWTAAASGARRRFGNKPATGLIPSKALSPLRSASAVQKLPPKTTPIFQRRLFLKTRPNLVAAAAAHPPSLNQDTSRLGVCVSTMNIPRWERSGRVEKSSAG